MRGRVGAIAATGAADVEDAEDSRETAGSLCEHDSVASVALTRTARSQWVIYRVCYRYRIA